MYSPMRKALRHSSQMRANLSRDFLYTHLPWLLITHTLVARTLVELRHTSHHKCVRSLPLSLVNPEVPYLLSRLTRDRRRGYFIHSHLRNSIHIQGVIPCVSFIHCKRLICPVFNRTKNHNCFWPCPLLLVSLIPCDLSPSTHPFPRCLSPGIIRNHHSS